jgi:hypothetical protein
MSRRYTLLDLSPPEQVLYRAMGPVPASVQRAWDRREASGGDPWWVPAKRGLLDRMEQKRATARESARRRKLIRKMKRRAA